MKLFFDGKVVIVTDKIKSSPEVYSTRSSHQKHFSVKVIKKFSES